MLKTTSVHRPSPSSRPNTSASSVYSGMASPPAAIRCFSVKLVIDKGRSKVLYAEAGKDFVDFLFCLLSIPLGEIINLLGKDGLPGSSGNVYKSLEDLNDSFLLVRPAKEQLLHPIYASIFPSAGLNLRQSDIRFMKPKYLVCGYCKKARRVHNDTLCNGCGVSDPCKEVAYTVELSKPNSLSERSKEGVVKDSVKYMIRDDLVLAPMDTNAMLPLLKRLAGGGIAALEDRTVMVGPEEGKALLKALLRSTNVLTDVFLGTASGIARVEESPTVPAYIKHHKEHPTQ